MLTPVPCLHVLFRVAAGPRIGFGHLVRARVLSRALGVERASLSLRGPAVAARTARRLGFQLERAGRRRLLDRRRPDVLVIDDPSAAAARPWCATARQAGVPVVSIHDLGLAFCGADLAVDGSIVEPRVNPRSGRLLSGVQYSILDPAVARARGRRRKPATVLIALGGGPRRAVAGRLATALCSADRSLRVRIAGGFSAPPPKGRNGRVTWLGPQRGLA